MHTDEIHRSHRAGWLRAAVLGANDGIVSTASLILGVAAAEANRGSVLTAGVAGLVAGAMSMAAGEYVSVFSQKDAEEADLDREKQELDDDPEFELEELTQLYVARGVEVETAESVAAQLMAHDALDAHAREELGIFGRGNARPVQAALASAATFALGAAIPLIALAAVPIERVVPFVAGVSLVALSGLGAFGASAGGAPVARAAIRVTLWGAAAMALTTVVGRLFGQAF
ncbi:MAG: VIT1/CCC1 transporter family protein [Myxococcota bacterium]